MGANLRYIALRKRLEGMLAGSTDGASFDHIVDELYRGLPHYTAIAIFAVTPDGLEQRAGHGISEEQARQMAQGLAAAAVSNANPLLVSDITGDPRARPVSDVIIAELVVPVLYDNTVLLVLDVQSDRYATLGRADQELLTWLARGLTPVTEK